MEPRCSYHLQGRSKSKNMAACGWTVALIFPGSPRSLHYLPILRQRRVTAILGYKISYKGQSVASSSLCQPLMQSQTLKEPRSDKEMIDGVREQMLEAIRVRLRADVP